MPPNWDENRISAVPRTTTQQWQPEILRAAGYLPASPVYASLYKTLSYNIINGGAGNCTRVPDSASHFSA